MSTSRTFKTHPILVLTFRIGSVVLLYSVCRLLFYLLNKDLFGPIDWGNFSTILFGGTRFDLSAILYLNSLYILLFMLPIPYSFRKMGDGLSKWWFIGTNGLALLSNIADIGYYRFSLKRTTYSVFNQFSNERNKFKLSIEFLLEYWYFIFLVGFFIWLLFKLYRLVEVKEERFTWIGFTKNSLSLVLALGLSVIGMRGGWRHSTRPIAMSNAGDYISKPEESSIVLNTPFCIIKTILVKPLPEVHYFKENELDSIYSPIHQPKTSQAFNKLNVVILIVESLGKEHIGSLNTDLDNGTYKGYTPFIDSLVGQSLSFRYSFANGRKSIDGLPSILSSIPSINEPYVLTTYGNNTTQSLPALLKKEGYHTSFFHGAANGSMGFSAFTKQAGIDSYFGKTEYNNDADFDGMWGIWDEPFLQYMAQKLNTFKEPFFSSVFTTSSHHPFKVPKQYSGKFKKGPLPVQECIGYTDMALKRFFSTASKMPWFKNTLFVLTADHATISHFPEYQTTVGYYSVPIVFYNPAGNLKGMQEKSVQQIDIMPTILGILNYNKPYFAFGFDALATTDERFEVNNNEGSYSLFWKNYVLMNDGTKTTAIYAYKTDRLLKQNLVGKLAEQPIMENKLKAFIQQYNNRMIHNQLTVQ